MGAIDNAAAVLAAEGGGGAASGRTPTRSSRTRVS